MKVFGRKISFRTFRIEIIVLVVIGVGGVLVWWNFTSQKAKVQEKVVVNEATELKTYRNDEFGFEIKYTPGRKIGKENIDGVEAVYIFNKEDIEKKERCRMENAEKIREGIDFSPGPCRFGIYVSVQTKAQWEKQYLVERLYSLSVSRDALKLNRDYLAPDLAVAIPLFDNPEKFIVLESYYDEGESLALMLPTFNF